MSATRKEREKFIAHLTRALPGVPVPQIEHSAALLLRHAATHARLAEESCNGHPIQSQCPPADCDMATYNARVNKLQTRWDERIEKKEKQIEKRITQICAELGISARFGGDPRGYTVKLGLPNGDYNTWGGKDDGYGVPA